MKESSNDIYDLDAISPEGQEGFEIFKANENYHFHFNDNLGNCILLGQRYKSRKGCLNGVESVKKNMLIKEHILIHHEGELHHFTIKAGNNQEVARSRNFDSVDELENGLSFLYNYLGLDYAAIFNKQTSENTTSLAAQKLELEQQLLNKTTIENDLRERLWELENALAETTSSLNEILLRQESWDKEKSTLESKLVLLTKKLSHFEANQNLPSKEAVADFEDTNFVFKIAFYHIDNPNDVKVAVTHQLSKERKVIDGFNKESIIEFILSKLPTTIQASAESVEQKTVDQVTSRAVVSRPPTILASEEEPIVPDPMEVAAEIVETTVEEVPTTATPTISEIPKVATKKVSTIFQMKAFVEEIKQMAALPSTVKKRSKVAVSPPKEVSEEQLAVKEQQIVERMFGDGLQNVPQSTIIAPKKLIDSQPLSEEEMTAEELKKIQHFFALNNEKSKVKPVVQARKVVTKSTNPTGEAEEDLAILQKFFPKTQHPEQVINQAPSLDEIQKILDDAMQNPNATTKEDTALIQQFFPINQSISHTNQQGLESLKKGIPFTNGNQIALEELAVIQQFFPNVNQLKTTQQKSVDHPINFYLPKESESGDKIAREAIAKFFGIQQHQVSQKTGEALKDEIIANMLSNIASEEKRNPKELATIARFFGKKLTKDGTTDHTNASFPNQFKLVFNTNQEVDQEELKVVQQFFNNNLAEKNKQQQQAIKAKATVQRQQAAAANRATDIALFNKWFGKNVTTTSTNCNCR